jgi:hypothetical protein
MGLDWFSVCLGILVVLIFGAIFTLLRTMSSPYIKRFDVLVKGSFEEIEKAEESYRISFNFEGRPFELLELKSASKENFKKVYNSFVLMRAKTNTDFTLRIEDILGKVNVAAVLEEVLAEKWDNTATEMDARSLGEFFKDFRISTNDRTKAARFLTHPEVLAILAKFKAQFSVYGFLMPLVISKGTLTIDYSLSERLVNELVFNVRNILEHARYLNTLAVHIEQKEPT